MVNVTPVQHGKTTRMSFGKISEVIPMPNLIEIQKNSYDWFLTEGLKEVFSDIEITDHNDNLVLTFGDYYLNDTPKYTIAECKDRDVTYAKKLNVRANLYNRTTGEIKSEDVYMGDLPIMTESGTFVINGAERVVVSQLVRSPGVYYDVGDTDEKSGKSLFKSTVIPNRGAWLEYEIDASDVIYVRIDKNRKIPITTFIRAIGIGTDEEIAEKFGSDKRLTTTIRSKDVTRSVESALIEVYKKLRPGEPPTPESAKSHLDQLLFDPKRYDLARFGRYKYNKKLGIASRLKGHRLAEPVADPATGEIIAEEGELITREKAEMIQQAGVMEVSILADHKQDHKDTHAVSEELVISDDVPEADFIKIIGNGMVDISGYVDFDASEYGINELVSYRVLRDILDNTEDPED
ncbi:MAG: DNA-directed RNA polymerase subunit beta, partial [Oscillospiraceae bacterium]|nr:DNA-directed RNA polymerase subunit beta [Oscillospiraceae bacterium]